MGTLQNQTLLKIKINMPNHDQKLYIKVSYTLKLLRENIIWLLMKICDNDLIVTNKDLCKSIGNSIYAGLRPAQSRTVLLLFTFCHFCLFCHLLSLFATFCQFLPLFATFCHFLPLFATFCHLSHFSTNTNTTEL